jgi:hypothetical protein
MTATAVAVLAVAVAVAAVVAKTKTLAATAMADYRQQTSINQKQNGGNSIGGNGGGQ